VKKKDKNNKKVNTGGCSRCYGTCSKQNTNWALTETKRAAG